MAGEKAVREALVKALEADLVGPFLAEGRPGGGEEVLPLPPSRWYLTGFLAPQGARAPEPEDEESEGELAAGSESRAEDAGSDEPEPKRPVRFPASMGLSVFLPAGEGDHVEVEVSFADYEKEPIAEGDEAHTKVGWRRVPRRLAPVKVPLGRRVTDQPAIPILRPAVRETLSRAEPSSSMATAHRSGRRGGSRSGEASLGCTRRG